METIAKKQISVFISYAREDDEPFVEKLYQDLKRNGFDVWWDRATMKNRGRTFLQEIRDAIENSDLLIAVIGPKATESDSVRYEWEYALLFSKGVIPILRMGDYTLLPPEMSKLHCPDFRVSRPYKKALDELVRLLNEPIPLFGQMIGVPSLPPNYLPRKDDLNKIKELILTDTIKPVVITSAKQITALQGMGGMGKSVLASAFARTAEARKAFYDGIFWVTVGLDASESDLIVSMRLIGTKFGDDPANYGSKKEAEASFSRVFSDKVCLIILDDIWKVPQATPFFNAVGQRCRLLITTRNDDVVTALGAQEHKIKLLSKPESLNLLANWCEQDRDSLPSEVAEVANECGYLPLALSICGAMAKSEIAWSDILEALQEADLEYIEAHLPNYQNSNVMKALKVSVDFLSSEDPDAVLRYRELAIFPADEFVPEVAIETLWAHTGNLKKRDVRKLLTKFKDRSLLRLDGKAPSRFISLHDLQFDYLRATAGDLPSLHNQLLEAYSKECGNKWINGPDDGYFYEHLAYHMKEAGRNEELHKLLLNFGWMSTKLKKACIIQDKNGVEKPDVNSLIHDYDYLPDDKEIELVKGAIRLSFNAIVQDKTQLAGQLLGRLLRFREDGIQTLLSQACESKDGIRLLPKISSLQSPGGPLIRTLEGHENSVNAVAVISDGKCVISASYRKLQVWNLERSEEKTTLKGHDGWVSAVAVTFNGKYAVSASHDRTLKVWNLKKGEEKATLKGHERAVNAVAITPNGEYAISASRDQTLKVWNLEKGEVKTTFKGHERSVSAVAVTPDGKCVVSSSHDGTLKIWDLERSEEKATLKGHNNWVSAVAVTPDGKYVVSASEDGTLKVWDLETGKEKTTLKGHSSRVNAVAITPDGKHAVSASDDKTLKVWDLERSEEKTTLKGHDYSVSAVAITSNGKYAVSASYRTVKVWDLEKVEENTALEEYRYLNWVNEIKVTPNGNYVVSSVDKTLRMWDLVTGKEKTKLEGHGDWISAVAITSNGKYAVSASYDRTVKVWNLETGEEKTIKTGYDGWVNTIAITPDGKYAILASYSSYDRALKVWDLEAGKEKTKLEGHEYSVTAIAVTPDGKYAVSASDGRKLIVWNLRKGKGKRILKGHDDSVNAVVVTSDGKYAVSASDDRTLKVWNLETGKEKTTLKGHKYSVNAVAITPNGKYAVSASYDRTVKVWNLEKGIVVSTFTGDSSFNTCDISPDGESIVARDASGKMHFLHFDKPD